MQEFETFMIAYNASVNNYDYIRKEVRVWSVVMLISFLNIACYCKLFVHILFGV